MIELERSLGGQLANLTSAVWGNKNATWLATVDGVTDVAVQIYSDAHAGEYRLRALRHVHNHSSLPVPVIIASGSWHGVIWSVSTRMEGVPGYEAAGSDLSSDAWPSLAACMGVALQEFGTVPIPAWGDGSTWRTAGMLRVSAAKWLENIDHHLSPGVKRHIEVHFEYLDELYAGSLLRVCHGDFGPQNVLFKEGVLSAILDFEDVRIGPELTDVAWWNWLVRAHTPTAFRQSWHRFEGAAVPPEVLNRATYVKQLRALIIMRLLETAETYRINAPEKYASWAVRLEKELLVTDNAIQAKGD
ncbi:aminoglycoside phosphotransferase family protein [Clavibacter californiensis]|uniref:aminoglycoside phosphotransferase family protein n=1 Tax=Clavibacter californiensis TaxID=1401995 RepID=UPI0015FCE093|nr:aminoglycoside phosphotransferase family protein [Clavibacter californiensis]UKF81697.1 aminoglycoside phosphotransferase family protein [Clavibacter californiensis]